jgi:hypothetical protein
MKAEKNEAEREVGIGSSFRVCFKTLILIILQFNYPFGLTGRG